MNLESFLALSHVTAIAPHPNGTSVAVAVSKLDDRNVKRRSEIWQVSLAGSDAPLLLAAHAEGVSAPAYDASGTLFALSKAATAHDDAKTIAQVWRFDEAGKGTTITNEPLGVDSFHVAGQRLAVLAPVLPTLAHEEQRTAHRDREEHGPTGQLYRDMTVRSWDQWLGGPAPHLIVYTLTAEGAQERRDLSPEFERELYGRFGVSWDLSQDGTRVVAVCSRKGDDRIDDSGIIVVDVATGEHRHLGTRAGLTHENLCLSPDGAHVACVRHQREVGTYGASIIAIYECDGENVRMPAPTWDCSPTELYFASERSLIVTAPQEGSAHAYELSLVDGAHKRLTVAGTHSHIHVAGDRLVGVRSTFSQPPEVFSSALVREALPQACTNLSGVGDAVDIRTESLTCEGAGGTAIQYFVLTPSTPTPSLLTPSTAQQPRPTLVWIHGGPVHSWTDGWHWRWNPLPFLEAGYNVVCPNPRGSTGFGQEFIDGIVGNTWGDACYRDVMAVVDAVSAREDVDAERLVAMGGSFGGYMCNWIGGQSQRFCAMVSHAGLYRLSAFHGTTDWPAYWAQQMGVHPSEHPDEYDRYSPHRFVGNWKTPVLISHGEKDYRVPISEALMLFEDLRRADVDARLLVFPDENHWILRPRNVELWYRSCLDFIAEHTTGTEDG